MRTASHTSRSSRRTVSRKTFSRLFIVSFCTLNYFLIKVKENKAIKSNLRQLIWIFLSEYVRNIIIHCFTNRTFILYQSPHICDFMKETVCYIKSQILCNAPLSLIPTGFEVSVQEVSACWLKHTILTLFTDEILTFRARF